MRQTLCDKCEKEILPAEAMYFLEACKSVNGEDREPDLDMEICEKCYHEIIRGSKLAEFCKTYLNSLK